MRIIVAFMLILCSFSASSQSSDLLSEGNLKLRNDDFSGAIAVYNKIIKENPGHYVVYFNRALAHTAVDKYLEALYDYRMFIDLAPVNDEDDHDNWKTAYERSAMILMSLEAYQEAIEILDEALDIDMNFGEAYFWRGVNKISIGNKSEGCTDLNLSVAFNIKESMDYIQKYCD